MATSYNFVETIIFIFTSARIPMKKGNLPEHNLPKIFMRSVSLVRLDVPVDVHLLQLDFKTAQCSRLMRSFGLVELAVNFLEGIDCYHFVW